MTASLTLLATQVLAAQPGDDTGGQGPDFGKASPVALVVLILLFIAVAFLIRSMTRHLKRVPSTFDPEEAAAQEEAEKASRTEQSSDTEQTSDPGQTSDTEDQPHAER